MEGFLLLLIMLLGATFFFNHSTAVHVGERCGFNMTCDLGLPCETCFAASSFWPRCVRSGPVIPTSQVKMLPFNRYSWLTTHNSFARMGATSFITGSTLIFGTNQMNSVTAQLKNGVRGLMLDMHEFDDDIWLCHGKCDVATAFQPALMVLKEVQIFLHENPSEIITIMIEDHVESPKGLTKLFDAAGIRNLSFPLSRMPKDGRDWPTVYDMVQKNQRLVVFTSNDDKQASEGIAYQWNYMVENQYGDDGMNGYCINRAEPSPMNSVSKSLVLMNYFRSSSN
ncbi:PI-PLC X domain-containing protein At5g67130, partial [Morus notabilis]|uniref:PI-PLC X domain-containing protein At5g67130 n=1 Tax=Morus notabilis TaxID=981085 RepID=UPI000CED3701